MPIMNTGTPAIRPLPEGGRKLSRHLALLVTALTTFLSVSLTGCEGSDGGLRVLRAPNDPLLRLHVGLSSVCGGQGVPEAAPYSSELPISPIVLLKLEGPDARHGVNFPISYLVPQPWWPDSLAQAELVACLFDEEILLQRCEYEGENAGSPFNVALERFRRDRTLTLHEARTGERLASHFFGGSAPQGCPDEFLGVGEAVLQFTGDTASVADLMDWLRPFVVRANNNQEGS